MKLILASGSTYRAQLLERLQLPFDQISSSEQEVIIEAEPPSERALRLSLAKALDVASKVVEPAFIIGSDQVAFLEADRETKTFEPQNAKYTPINEPLILSKPGSYRNAFEQLLMCSGKTVKFATGCCVLNSDNGVNKSALDIVTVKFRNLCERQIEHYLKREQPLDCAGSFKIEGLGICLVESVQSDDPTTLIGMSLISLCRLLLEFGIDPATA